MINYLEELKAKLIEKKGFKISFIGGFALSSSRIGYPDARDGPGNSARNYLVGSSFWSCVGRCCNSSWRHWR